jgi:hypothetical protein
MRKGHGAVSLLYSLVRVRTISGFKPSDIYSLVRVGEVSRQRLGGLRLTRSGFNRPVRSRIFKTDLTLYHVGSIAHNT